MSSSEMKMDEMIEESYVLVPEQDYAGMLVPKKCDEQEKTYEKQREADNGTGQPAEADNGTGQVAEADNETGQPAEADNGTGQAAEADNEIEQPAEADNGTGQPAEADNGTGQAAEADNETEQPAEADNGTGQPAEADDGTEQPAEGNDGTGQPSEEKKPSIQALLMALERPMIRIGEYNWPEEDEEFDGRNVVVIGINGSREAEDAFKWYLTTLYHRRDLVVVVYALEIGPRLGLLSTIEDWSKETQRIIDTQTALHDLYRRRFFDLKLQGAIVSRKGESGQLIIKEAKERRAAYIIIGKRSQDANLHQVVTNSTSDFVFCNANCPVLVCKTDPNRQRNQIRHPLPRRCRTDE